MEILENRAEWLKQFQEGWLHHFQLTGEYNWKIYNRPRNQTPVPGKGIDLAKSRLMLITSAGAYLANEQEPFDAANPLGDYSIRTFPSTTPAESLAFAHDHYDHAAVNRDQQTLVPLRHLAEMRAEGRIGELAPSVISFMGYQPDATRTVSELIPAILQATKAERITAALLVPA